MNIWVVWENNSQQPHLFYSEEAAFTYRRKRVSEVRRQVYIGRTIVEGELNAE